jgi:hypothetical protein
VRPRHDDRCSRQAILGIALLCPLAIVEGLDGERRLLRFEAETQAEAVERGKAAVRDASSDAAMWAFARENLSRSLTTGAVADVLSVDFWARGMSAVTTLIQPFARRTHATGFKIQDGRALVVNGVILAPDEAASSLAAIDLGVRSHPRVSELWASWV